MKKILIFSCFCLSLFFHSFAFAKENTQSLDKIAAIVNEEVITDSELSHQISLKMAQLRASDLPVPEESALRKETLEELINIKLELQIAKNLNVSVTDAEVKEAIQNIATNNHVSVEAIYQKLATENMSEADYVKTIHDQMLTQKLAQQELASTITASDAEVKQYLTDLKNHAPMLVQYKFENLLLPVPDNASRVAILNLEKRADALLEKLRAGQTIQSIIAAQKKLTPALETHQFDFMFLNDAPTVYAEALPAIKANEYSDVLKASNGFHILHLLATRSVKAPVDLPDEAHAREALMMKKFQDAIEKWQKTMRASAYIQITP